MIDKEVLINRISFLSSTNLFVLRFMSLHLNSIYLNNKHFNKYFKKSKEFLNELPELESIIQDAIQFQEHLIKSVINCIYNDELTEEDIKNILSSTEQLNYSEEFKTINKSIEEKLNFYDKFK